MALNNDFGLEVSLHVKKGQESNLKTEIEEALKRGTKVEIGNILKVTTLDPKVTNNLQNLLYRRQFTIRIGRIDAAKAIADLKTEIRTAIAGTAGSGGSGSKGSSGGGSSGSEFDTTKWKNNLTQQIDRSLKNVYTSLGRDSVSNSKQGQILAEEAAKLEDIKLKLQSATDITEEYRIKTEEAFGAAKTVIADADAELAKFRSTGEQTINNPKQWQANFVSKIDSKILSAESYLGSHTKINGTSEGAQIRENIESLKELRNSVMACQNVTQNFRNTSENTFSTLNGGITSAKSQAEELGNATNTLFTRFKNGIAKFGGWTIVTRALTAVIRLSKQMVTNVKEIDAAMTQLQIVTDASNRQMEQFTETANTLSQQLGKNVSDVLKLVETFSRLGYSLDDASELAKYAAILSNVASVDTNEATTGLTSIIKGYNLDVEEAEHVADVLTQVGQRYAVSASEMMEAYEKSGAALSATNTSFEKSAGLIAAANASVQNASTVGTALKTISARIRGSKTELDGLGESTEDLAEGFSKYADEIKALTGFDIMVDTTHFKDIYDIMDGIAQKWGDLSDTTQARVSEILGGTRQLQVISSILGNWKDATSAYETAINSAGAATEANSKYLDSIEGRTAQLTATFQALSQTIIDSGIIKDLLRFVTEIVKGLDNLGQAVGKIPTWIKVVIVGLTATISLLPRLVAWMDTLSIKTVLTTISQEGFAVALAQTSSTGVMGLITLIPKLILALTGYIICQKSATQEAITFAAALETVNLNPLVLALTAIIAAVAALGYHLYSVSSMGTGKKLSEDSEELANTTSDIQSLNDELETTNKRIAELLSKENPTFVEQDELERLQKTNAELDRELTLKKALQKDQQRQVKRDFFNTMEAWAKTDSKLNMFAQVGTGSFADIPNMYRLVTDPQSFLTTNRLNDLFDKVKAGGTDSDRQALQDTIVQLREYKAAIDDAGISYDELTQTEKAYYDLIEQYEVKYAALQGTVGDALKVMLENGKWSFLNDELQVAIENGEDLDSVYGGLSGKLNNNSWKAFTEELAALADVDYDKANQTLLQYILHLKDAENGTESFKTTTETALDKLKSKMSDVSSEIDNIQSAYDAVEKLISDYNENGYLSLDNLQALLQLTPEYLNLLVDENGQLNLNAQSYADLAKAKLQDLLLTQIKTTFANILSMGVEEAAAYAAAEAYSAETDSLYALIEAETQQALLKASIKDSENNTTAYSDAVSRYISYIPTLVSLVDNYDFAAEHTTQSTEKMTDALEGQKEALEDQKEALEDSKEALQDYQDGLEDAQRDIQNLIDLVMDYIKKQKEAEKEVLEERKNEFDDLIEKEKEELALKKEAAEFDEQLKNKQNAYAKDVLAASIASLDDSAAGRKAQKEANDALVESRDDLNSLLAEHEYDIRVKALDALKETQDEYYEAEIKKIDDYLDSERQIYEDACRMIDNDTGDLYGKLWDYTYQYTTKTRAEFDYMWSAAQAAMERYGGAQMGVINLMEYLQNEIYSTETEINNLDDAIGGLSNEIDSVSKQIDALGNESVSNLSNQISNLKSTINSLNDLNSPKWVYEDYNGKDYYSKLSNRGDAIKDIMRQMGVDPVNYSRAGSAIGMSSKFHRYAKGTLSAAGGLSELDEYGHEIRVLNKGDGILTAKITKNLANLGADPAGVLMDAGKQLLSKLSSTSLYQTLFGTNAQPVYGVSSAGNQPIIFENTIHGDVNPSTLKALVKAQKQITQDAINGMMKTTLGLRANNRV